jgi:hypothetical protein
VENELLFEGLQQLARKEMLAAAACSAQLSRLGLAEMADRVFEMKLRHGRHVDEINALLGERGGEAQAVPPDMEGPVHGDYRCIAGMSETGPALVSVQATQESLLEAYEELIGGIADASIRARLEGLAAEVRGHVQYVEETLRSSWEEPEDVGVGA